MNIYDSHIEGAQYFKPKVRGEIYRAIIEYLMYGVEPDYLKGEAMGYFVSILPLLESNRGHREAGRKGGEQKAKNRLANDLANDLANGKQTSSKTGSKTPSKSLAKSKSKNIGTNVPIPPIAPHDEVLANEEANDETQTAIVEVVDYLNAKAGTAYKPTSEATRKLIRGRLSDGFTVSDFKAVIDNRCESWLNDDKMREYLRPSTLFRPSNFEAYLNAPKGGDDYDFDFSAYD